MSARSLNESYIVPRARSGITPNSDVVAERPRLQLTMTGVR